MRFQEILNNNPKAFVDDCAYERDVYDVINRYILREDYDVPMNTILAIPKHSADMVAALMTSTTKFRVGHGSITFYARNQIWICTDHQLTSKSLMLEQHQTYFDNSPLHIHIGNGYVYTHQTRNVMLITRYYDNDRFALPDHILIIFPERFTVVPGYDAEYYNRTFAVKDSTTQQSYYCDLQFKTPAEFIKVLVSPFPTDEEWRNANNPCYRLLPTVDIGIRIIID